MARTIILQILLLVIVNISGCSNESRINPIDKVKNGMLDNDKTRTIGAVFDNYQYFSELAWETFASSNGKTIVLLTGIVNDEILKEYNYAANQDSGFAEENGLHKVVSKVQFTFDQDEKTFQLTYMGYEGYTDNGKKIYESEGSIEKISEIYDNKMSMILLKWCANPITTLKNMKISSDYKKTIGEAFENYSFFKEVQWKSKKKSDTITSITVIGTYTKEIEKYYMGKILTPVSAMLIVDFEINNKNKSMDLKSAVLKGYLADSTAVKGVIPMKLNIPAEPIEIIQPIFNNKLFGKDMFNSIMWVPQTK